MRNITIALTLAVVMPLQSPAPYRITHTYPLGGEGGWDYIVPDPSNHRLFIARQNRVMVVDEDNGTLLGRGHRHPGRARDGGGGRDRARIRHLGQ